jgi:hypothetical protein
MLHIIEVTTVLPRTALRIAQSHPISERLRGIGHDWNSAWSAQDEHLDTTGVSYDLNIVIIENVPERTSITILVNNRHNRTDFSILSHHPHLLDNRYGCTAEQASLPSAP